jgi:hypothetical protein
MTDLGDPQDRAESLDPEVLPDYDDPEGKLEYPPDTPEGVRDYGTTAEEERIDEPLDERVRREVPDPLDDLDEPDERVLAEIEAEQAERALYEDEELDYSDIEEDRANLELDDVDDNGSVGRLVEPGADDDAVDFEDDEPDLVATSVDEEDLSAEEDAIHLTMDPPFDEAGDGYIDVDDIDVDDDE